jgi:hypothetical protein
VGASAGAAGFAASSAGATTSAAAGASVCANARAGEKASVVARIVGATSANRIFRVVMPFLQISTWGDIATDSEGKLATKILSPRPGVRLGFLPQ